MTKKRRNHSPEFKANVTLAAAKDDKTVAKLAQKYNLYANQISTWKKEQLGQSIKKLVYMSNH
ncbi:transposase [Vibrio lentus]|uniref:Transposase n=1 Tax=Vibrio lentus TaxID=136468 RepID=A0A2N7IB06_9VIBR|nr:transposase [Vibrio lentus]